MNKLWFTTWVGVLEGRVRLDVRRERTVFPLPLQRQPLVLQPDFVISLGVAVAGVVRPPVDHVSCVDI